MTVSAANPPFNEYTAAPGATVFPYTFKIIKSDDMTVLVNGVAKVIGTDYSLSGVGANNGGNITFLAPMVGGENVVARMNLAFDRQTDYQQNGDFRSPTVNSDFDRLWLALQQMAQSQKASIKLPFTTTADQSITQSAAQRANTILAFDAAGNLTISTTDAENVALAQEAAAAAVAAAASINPADLVHKTGNETIGGTKTFSLSPQIPNVAAGNSSQNAANTAFVSAALAALDALVVHLAGAETIAGTKTFSTPPIAKNLDRAWVNFNGTGAITIRDSYNVTTVGDTGVGLYTVNFTSTVNASGAMKITFIPDATILAGGSPRTCRGFSQGSTAIVIESGAEAAGAGTRIDFPTICLAVT